jgi:hypothetical protein
MGFVMRALRSYFLSAAALSLTLLCPPAHALPDVPSGSDAWLFGNKVHPIAEGREAAVDTLVSIPKDSSGHFIVADGVYVDLTDSDSNGTESNGTRNVSDIIYAFNHHIWFASDSETSPPDAGGHATDLCNSYQENGSWQDVGTCFGYVAGKFYVESDAAPTPEPAGWALMLVGLACVGTALRRAAHPLALRLANQSSLAGAL